MNYKKKIQLMGKYTAAELKGAVEALEFLVNTNDKKSIDKGFKFLYNLIETKTEKEGN